MKTLKIIFISAVIINFIFSNINILAQNDTSPTKSIEISEQQSRRLFEQFKCTTYDGVILFGQYMPPESPDKPTIILLHQLGSQITSYQKLLPDLKNKGYGVCLYDARGHGLSVKTKNGQNVFYTNFRSNGTDNEWNKMKLDLGEVIDFLKKEKGLKGDVKLIGSSIGGNIAFNFASENPKIKTVIMLSPGINYHNVIIKDTAVNCVGKNILLVSAKGDSFSANSCEQVKNIILSEQKKQNISTTDNIRYLEIEGKEHGTKMLTPELIKEILIWLEK